MDSDLDAVGDVASGLSFSFPREEWKRLAAASLSLETLLQHFQNRSVE